MYFFDYCERNNIQLSRDDKKFIRRAINFIAPGGRKAILREYVDIFNRVYAECGCDIRGTNLGKRAANQYLLRIIEDATGQSKMV